jgi:hypothetical protein
MDATTQGGATGRAPAAGRRLVLTMVAVAIVTAVLAAVVLSRATMTADRDVRPATPDLLETTGLDDHPALGGRRSGPLTGLTAAPLRVSSHPSSGPHPAGIDPKRG